MHHARNRRLRCSPAGLILAFALAALAAAEARANVVCTNGRCITCDGPISCSNNVCTCNGVPVEGGAGATPAPPQGPCGGELTFVHGNGGGAVAQTASVAASVFVSGDSVVCGRAQVSGPTRLLSGSVVNGASQVTGRSTLSTAAVTGAASVSDSALTRSVVNGNASIARSQLVNSTVNGHAVVTDSEVVNSVLNGNASVVGRKVQNAVVNN